MSIITDEEKDDLSKKVWDQMKTEIEASVSAAIRAELRSAVSSRTRALISKEVDQLLKPAIEARKDELVASAEKAIARIFAKMEESVLDSLDRSLSYDLRNMFDKVGSAFSTSLLEATRKVVAAQKKILQEEATQRYLARSKEQG